MEAIPLEEDYDINRVNVDTKAGSVFDHDRSKGWNPSGETYNRLRATYEEHLLRSTDDGQI